MLDWGDRSLAQTPRVATDIYIATRGAELSMDQRLLLAAAGVWSSGWNRLRRAFEREESRRRMNTASEPIRGYGYH